jgi:iron complex transport system substrate-binding protein
MKICSFLPGGTEMVYALGLADSLVGVSRECDFPPEVKAKPVVVRSVVDGSGLSSGEIHARVMEKLKAGGDLYVVDRERLQTLRPDLVISQELCRVCAPSEPEAKDALAVLPEGSRVLYLSPRTLEDIFENIRSVGEATGALERAQEVVYDLRLRAVTVQTQTFRRKRKPRVFVLEWLDPLFAAGHWVPEMVDLAGGLCDRTLEASRSEATDWDRIAAFNPDVLVVAPCGFHLDRAVEAAGSLRCPQADRINAFREGRVYAVDGDSYFTRPGPRVVDGIELLAHILDPDAVPWKGPADAFRRVSRGGKLS